MFKLIHDFAKKYKSLFIMAEICIVITYAVSLILPFILTKLVDDVIYGKNYTLLNNIIFSYVFLFLVSLFTNMIYAYLWQNLYNNFVVDVKCEVYQRVIKSKAENLSNMNSGDIMNRIDHDCDQFLNVIQRNLFHFLNSILLCSGIVIIIAKINLQIALLAVLAAALPIIFTRVCGKFNEKYSRENREVTGTFTGRLYEILKGFREIKINNSKSWATNQIIVALKKLIALGNKLRFVDFSVNKGIYLLNLTTSILIYILSVKLISNNILTIGGFLAIIQYIALLHRKFNWMLRIYLDWRSRKVSIERVTQVLNYEEEPDNGDTVDSIKNIVFSNVHFGYGEAGVLTNVSFSIHKGEKVAIVGESGIGKSTIINLILSLYDVKEGTIYINNLPINDISKTSLRKACSIVSQDIILFDGTIRENLLVGYERSDEEVYNALDKVGLLDKIKELPEGLDTKINNGFDLSGGQKQRLMIARALLRGTDTFIFDEATSALDVLSEKEIINNILSENSDYTVIIISHRYVTAAACEKIIVINNGSIEYAGDFKGAKASQKFTEMFGEACHEN